MRATRWRKSLLCVPPSCTSGRRGARLLLSVHHLGLDGVSCALEDLGTAWRAIPMLLPLRPRRSEDVGVRLSSSRLEDIARERTTMVEGGQRRSPCLPRDGAGGRSPWLPRAFDGSLPGRGPADASVVEERPASTMPRQRRVAGGGGRKFHGLDEPASLRVGWRAA